jgi:hypothetical protein
MRTDRRRTPCIAARLTLALSLVIALLTSFPPLARASRAPALLDLPAMALNLSDLSALGLDGYAHRGSALLGGSDYLARQIDGNPLGAGQLRDLLGNGKAVARYELSFDHPGNRIRSDARIGTYLVQFASETDARAWYDYAAIEPVSGLHADVPHARQFGDVSELTESTGPSDDPEGKYAEYDYTVQIGTVYAGVQRVNFAEVSATVERPAILEMTDLMTQLVARIEAGVRGQTPGLSDVALELSGSNSSIDRFSTSDLTVFAANYTLIDGAYQPYGHPASATFDAYQSGYDRIGAVAEYHEFTSTGQQGEALPGIDLWITSFKDERAAADRLANTRALSPTYLNQAVIDSYDPLGNESIFFSYDFVLPNGQQVSGHRIDVQVGTVVFRLSIDAIDPFDPGIVYDMARAEVACLAVGACGATYAFPVAEFGPGG